MDDSHRSINQDLESFKIIVSSNEEWKFISNARVWVETISKRRGIVTTAAKIDVVKHYIYESECELCIILTTDFLDAIEFMNSIDDVKYVWSYFGVLVLELDAHKGGLK